METKTDRPKSEKHKSLFTELVEVIALAVIFFLVITFLMQTVHVIGHSMDPTLHDQDLLIATKFDYRLHHPQRGDIVILKSPTDYSTDYIKRVIGTPGDRISVVGGQLSINGHQMNETYRNESVCLANCNWPPEDPVRGEVLPADEYFVMGDNRNNSSDSRVFGLIHGDQIEARAWIRIWPLDHMGPVSSPPKLIA